MNKIRVISDLHLEMDPQFKMEKVYGEEHTHLILAGDICVWKYFEKEVWNEAFREFFNDCSERFKTVYYIPGNHEYYGSDINAVDDEMREFFNREFSNIHFLNNETANIEGTKFIFSTLWSYVDENTALFFRKNMSDFNVIRDDEGILHPEKTNELHSESVKFIEEELRHGDMQKVVVTHHLPSYKSVHPRFQRSGPMNYFFYTNLEPLIMEHEPLMWIHGHTHDSMNYMLGNTNVVCNPKGYGGPQPNFDNDLTLTC